MKSIQSDFKRAMREDSNIGEYVALARAVRGKKYTRRTLNKNIHLLGEKDMDASMKKMLVEHLFEQSKKEPEEVQNEGIFTSNELLVSEDDPKYQIMTHECVI